MRCSTAWLCWYHGHDKVVQNKRVQKIWEIWTTLGVSVNFTLWLRYLVLLLLLLSRFSRVRLLVTPWTVALQVPLSMILQARVPEWVAISFSNAWKWKVKVKSFSHVRLLVTQWTAAHQALPSLEFSRQEHWSGLPFPSPIHEHEKWKWSHSVVSDS